MTDLARTLWDRAIDALGAMYSALVEARSVGDYGGLERVSGHEAAQAVQEATSILRAVAAGNPGIFSGVDPV